MDKKTSNIDNKHSTTNFSYLVSISVITYITFPFGTQMIATKLSQVGNAYS